jgi:Spy/CpxP family protein refolding chaperone
MIGKTMNSKLMAGIFFLGTLVFGVFAGVVLDRTVLRPLPRIPAFRSFDGPLDAPPRMHAFSKRLDLTAEQVKKLGDILESYRLRFGDLRMSMHPRYTALRDSLNADIRAILTPEQQEKFETMLREFKPRRRWRHEREPVIIPDGPPPMREPD